MNEQDKPTLRGIIRKEVKDPEAEDRLFWELNDFINRCVSARDPRMHVDFKAFKDMMQECMADEPDSVLFAIFKKGWP